LIGVFEDILALCDGETEDILALCDGETEDILALCDGETEDNQIVLSQHPKCRRAASVGVCSKFCLDVAVTL
jgi:hypothetical protein